jgi:hypothetical protein
MGVGKPERNDAILNINSQNSVPVSGLLSSPASEMMESDFSFFYFP